MSQPPPDGLTMDLAVEALARGELTLLRQIAWSSNDAYLVEVLYGDLKLHAVYKPRSGEAPLWDFERGSLCLREMAAFVVSEAVGWRLVPPTTLRSGPLGFGALQVFVPHDPEDHYLALTDPDPEAVARIAAFDVVINNADRKSGHVLRAADGALWAIDHGVSFHAEPKLRTVIWDFAGLPLPSDVADELAYFVDRLADRGSGTASALSRLLSGEELRALESRVRVLLADAHYPQADPSRRAIPWPPI